MPKTEKPLTNQQSKWISYLFYEAKRQKDTEYEWSSYPEFMLSCCGCFIEFKTSDPDRAREFIFEHAGHKGLSLEVNQIPDAREYRSRREVLKRLADFGTYLVNIEAPDVVITNARLTYRFILNDGNIEGSLKRLLEVCLGTSNGQCHTDGFTRLWLTSILNNDHKFIRRVTSKIVAPAQEKGDNNDHR